MPLSAVPFSIAGLDPKPHRPARRPSPSAARFRPPFICQERPDGAPSGYDGSANCGPAVMTMILRALGRAADLADAELIERFAEIGGTTLEAGTELLGLATMSRSIGAGVQITPGLNLGKLEADLRRGCFVIANGDYYAMKPHEDSAQYEGHYILIYGVDANGHFLVRDPSDAAVHAVSGPELESFFDRHDEGGHQITIDVAPKQVSPMRHLVGLRQNDRAPVRTSPRPTHRMRGPPARKSPRIMEKITNPGD